MLELTGMDISVCPHCKKGTMIIVREIPKPLSIIYPNKIEVFDSS
jgi:hypothetical protein